MKFKENIQKLLAEALSLQPDLFLIDLHIYVSIESLCGTRRGQWGFFGAMHQS